MFNSALIKKDKKKLKGAEKSYLGEALMGHEKVEAEDFKGTNKIEPKKLEGTMKLPESKVPSANKASPESTMSMDMFLKSAKKEAKEDVNATSDMGEHFKVDTDKDGKYKESGMAKERYLKRINKLKSK